MTKNNFWSNGLLNLLFNAATLAGIAQNATAGPITAIYFSLHTADPSASGNQSTNEIAYTGYARVGVARTTGGFATTSNQTISPLAAVTFPQGSGGGGTATFFGVGASASGAGSLFYSGPISPNITCGSSITPQLTTATTITES